MDDRSKDPPTTEVLEERGFRELARVLVHGDEQRAEDLVQDAWLVLARRPERKIEELRPWLVGVLRNLARNRMRREQRRHRTEREGAQPEFVVSAEHELERRELEGKLTTLVAELPEPYARVVRLRYLEEYSAESVAVKLGRPAATIRSQAARGLALLREALDRRHVKGRAQWLAVYGMWSATSSSARRSPAAWTWAAASVVLVGVSWLAFAGSTGSASGTSMETAVAHSSAIPPDEALRASTSLIASRVALGVEVSADGSTDASPVRDGSRPANSATQAQVAKLMLIDPLGRGIPDADVYLLGPGGRRLVARSALDGSAEFEFGAADLVAEVRAFAPTSLAIFVEAEAQMRSDVVYVDRERCRGGAVTIPVNRGGVLLRGLVLDPSGAPLTGATIRLGEDVPSVTALEDGVLAYGTAALATSDAEGRFELRVEGGDIALGVRSAGRATRTFHERVRADLVHSCTLRLARGHDVRGIVRDLDGRPAAGALVTVDALGPGTRQEVRTDGDGAYALLDLDFADQTIFAQLGGAVDRTLVRAVVGGETEWNAYLQRARGFHVRIVDAAGAPRASWCVCLRSTDAASRWERVGITDADGRASILASNFDGPSQPVDIFVAPVRRYVPYPVAERLGVRAGEGELAFVVDDEQAGVGTLEGQLTDARSRPFDGRVEFEVQRLDRDLVTTVPVDVHAGLFRLEGLPRGDYLIQARRGAVPGVVEARASFGPCAIVADTTTRLASQRLLAPAAPFAPSAHMDRTGLDPNANH